MVGATLAVALAPDKWGNRGNTMNDYDEDKVDEMVLALQVPQ